MPPPPLPPPPLPDELVEEVLLRFPPENPAWLVRAGLVCKRWCRLVSGPGFRRRFREFHRRAPILGMLCNLQYGKNLSRFTPTTGFCFPRMDFPDMRVLDARHGRVLFETGSVLVVWDPITDEERQLPLPRHSEPCTAAVLCAVADCDHLGCHRGPFLVVFVSFNLNNHTFVYTCSSNAAAWSQPVCAQQSYFPYSWMGSALVGKALYFGNLVQSTALKYDLELHQVSFIQLPSLSQRSLFTTTEDGELGLISIDDSKLYMWSRKDTREVDAKWERRVIKLDTVFPVDVNVTKLGVLGSGVGIIFMRTGAKVYTVDLKTYKVKKVYEGTVHNIRPYMSFYTPVLQKSDDQELLVKGVDDMFKIAVKLLTQKPQASNKTIRDSNSDDDKEQDADH